MFKVYINDVFIGYSSLESGDPPMGVAIGKFVPSENFTKFDDLAIRENADTRSWNNATVKTPDGETLVSDGVSLAEYDISLTPSEPDFYLQLSCLGIRSPSYETLFPDHIAKYEAQMKSVP